jgi:WhiB family transcriptional regulator, redox-sensing transcriptional regulator
MTFPPSPRHYAGQPAGRAERAEPTGLTDEQLAASLMSPLARCSGTATDPDEWFPVAAVVAAARAEAERALALCAECPVRAECLEMSLRQWRTIGKYGIWGGLVEAERAAARREWLTGADVTALLPLAGCDVGDSSSSSAGVPAGADAPEQVRVTGLGDSRRKARRPAGAFSTGNRARRRSPRGAGMRPAAPAAASRAVAD